jgi:hypothetical protein
MSNIEEHRDKNGKFHRPHELGPVTFYERLFEPLQKFYGKPIFKRGYFKPYIRYRNGLNGKNL